MIPPDVNVLVYAYRCELVTVDRDFARFTGLRWRHPLQP